MAIGNIPRSDIDMKRAKEFVNKYNIQDINIKVREVADIQQYNFRYDYYSSPEFDKYIKYTHVNMYTMSMPESSFEDIIDRIAEIDNLMRDPETTKLLHEARFIYRLKYGTEK